MIEIQKKKKKIKGDILFNKKKRRKKYRIKRRLERTLSTPKKWYRLRLKVSRMIKTADTNTQKDLMIFLL